MFTLRVHYSYKHSISCIFYDLSIIWASQVRQFSHRVQTRSKVHGSQIKFYCKKAVFCLIKGQDNDIIRVCSHLQPFKCNFWELLHYKREKTGSKHIRETRTSHLYHPWSSLNTFCFTFMPVKLISGGSRWPRSTGTCQPDSGLHHANLIWPLWFLGTPYMWVSCQGGLIHGAFFPYGGQLRPPVIGIETGQWLYATIDIDIEVTTIDPIIKSQ